MGFEVYARVDEWPAWTASIRQVRRLDPGPPAPLLVLLTRRLPGRYLRLVCDGFRRCEQEG